MKIAGYHLGKHKTWVHSLKYVIFLSCFQKILFHCRLLIFFSSVLNRADNVIYKWMFHKMKKCISLEVKELKESPKMLFELCALMFRCVCLSVETLGNFTQCFLRYYLFFFFEKRFLFVFFLCVPLYEYENTMPQMSTVAFSWLVPLSCPGLLRIRRRSIFNSLGEMISSENYTLHGWHNPLSVKNK